MTVATAFAVLAVLGTMSRWVLGAWLPRPAGTLLVNGLGALALGMLLTASDSNLTVFGVAGLGALTTVSGAAADAEWLAVARGRTAAAAYVAVTVVAIVAAAWLGLQTLS